MKKAYFIVVLAVAFNSLIAQEEHKFINPQKVFEEAFTLKDSARYDDAAKTLLQIDKSDTSYVYMLTELASVYLAAEKYKDAIETADKALAFKSKHQLRLCFIKGNAFDQMGSPDSSIAVYERALKKYPYSYLLYYNMGITHVNQKKYEQAAKAFQQAIRLNPYHASSHLILGKICAHMGHFAHAILSLETFLTIEPNSDRSNPNLVFLNNFVNNALDADAEKITPFGKNAFEDLDQVLKSGIALNNGYKLKIDFEAPVARQTQLLFESLEYKENTGDFWMDSYVPVFMAVKQNNFMAPFVFRIVTSSPDKSVASQLRKNEKTIEEMKKLLGNNISRINKNYVVVENGKNRIVDLFLDDDGYLISMGKYKENGETRYGHWTFYHINGEQKEDGNYTDDGKLEGKWLTYDVDGTLLYIENYSKGQLHGDYIGYFPDGKKKFEAKYVNGHPEGEVKYYYDCNALSSVVNFKDDKRNGKGMSYFKNGVLKEEYFYVNDSLDGENKGYYPTGTLKWFYRYSDNKLTGKALNYFDNGQIESELEYVKNELTGNYKTYHKNGKSSITGTFKNGFRVGEWKEFNEKGILSEVSHYDEKGKLHGETKGFDDKGKPYYTYVYDKGKFKQYSYFNQNGKVITSGKVSNDETKIKGYYPDGNLLFDGIYKDGSMNGEWTYYYKSGVKKNLEYFKNNILDGKFLSYYKTGELNEDATYKDGELHGYYKKHNIDGVITSEGWYMNDKREGKWIDRNGDGTIDSESYYINGKLNGYSYDFASDGKIQFIRFYDSDAIKWIESFDQTGKLISKVQFDGKTDYYLPYMNGSQRAKGNFDCNEMNSKFVFYYKNGTPEVENNYLNDLKHGEFKTYHPSGIIRSTGFYKSGKKTGAWKYFHENGKPSKTSFYTDNNADSIWTTYHKNGKITAIEKYEDDALTDTAKYYNSLGEYMFSMIYNAGDLVGYSYDSPEGLVTKKINPKDTGTITTYFKNGKVSSYQPFKYNSLYGNCKFYFSTGKPYAEFAVKGTLNYGKFVEYYPTGKVFTTGSYLNDNYHGTFQNFREDGNIESSKEYKNGYDDGTFIYYDKTGKKTKTEKYWKDILL